MNQSTTETTVPRIPTSAMNSFLSVVAAVASGVSSVFGSTIEGSHLQESRAGRDQAPADVRYTLEFVPATGGGTVKPGIAVVLEFRGDDDGQTVLETSKEWGGIEADPAYMQNISASVDGVEAAVKAVSNWQWSISHAVGKPIRLRYELRERANVAPLERGANDYRTSINDRVVRFIGNHALMMPERFDDGAERTFAVSWIGFDRPGWRVASSYGSGADDIAVTMTADKFRHALFVAGEVRVVERRIRDTLVGFVFAHDGPWEATWNFDAGEFADLAVRVIAAQREFFDDFSDPWYLVSVTPQGRIEGGGFWLGGTALTNCFSLYCSAGIAVDPSSPFRSSVERLLAHEYFHTWNGLKLHVEGEQGSNYWFSEGFTEFFTRRMLARAGLWSAGQVLDDLSRSVAEYDANPRRHVPNSTVQSEFWKDQDTGKVPYRRGDLVAVALDEEIRRRSGGSRSLDDVIRELVNAARSGEAMPTTEALLSRFERETDAGFMEPLRRSIFEGSDVPLPATLSDPRARLTTGGMRTFDPGFDMEAARKEKVVRGVKPGSGAEEAGLRDGMKIRSATISSGSTTEPPKGEVVVIGEDGAERTFVYDAVGAVSPVRRYEPIR
jgi:predicted metalloprotease with PDZ domain